MTLKYSLKRFIKKIIPRKLLYQYWKVKGKKRNNLGSNCKLIMVLLCKNEEDIIEEWLIFHKNMGVDGFIITDNASTDNTRKILDKYKNKGWIYEIIDEPETNHYQDIFCDRMIKLAIKKYKADWIISADSDEFWYSINLSLKQSIFLNINSNVQFVKLVNYYPLSEKFNICKNNYFVTRYINVFESNKMHVNSRLFFRFKEKCLFKAKDYKNIILGNHDVIVRNRNECYTSEIKIYHYYVRNYSHFQNKVIKGGESMVKLGKVFENDYWFKWYEVYLSGKLTDAYNELIEKQNADFMIKQGVISVDTTVSNFLNELKCK